MSEQFTTIPIELLVYSGRNPRHDMRGIKEFAENIKEYGVLQPIIVRPKEEKFEVVVGERRVRASIMAGLREVPAIIRALTDRQTDELRLIENLQREDLTDAEKGDAIYTLLDNYPDKYPTIVSIARTLTVPQKSVYMWTDASRKLSPFVKSVTIKKETFPVKSGLGIFQASRLMKYDYSTQDKLAQKILEYELNQAQTRKFLKLYDENPSGNLDEYASNAKGVVFVQKLVEVPIEEYKPKRPTPPPQTKETRGKISRTRKKTEKRKKEAKKRKKAKKEKKPKPPPPLLPEEKKRLEKLREKIVRERKKKGKFMQTRADLAEQKIELPPTPVLDASTMLAMRKVTDEKRLNLFEAKDWMIFTKSWFIHNPPPRKAEEELHPAKFPEPMIKDFLKFFTQPTEIVLDPFLGTGSTLVACELCGRQGIGVEIEEKYVEVARRRTKQPIVIGDARNLDQLPILKDLEGKIDFAITSPPYWNMLSKSRGHVRSVAKIRKELGADVTYGRRPENLGNIVEYEEYLDTLFIIFKKVHKLLRKKRYLVVIIQNILTKDGRMKSVAWDLAKKLSTLFLLKQERIWCQDNKPLGCWGYPSRYVSNVHHHYCLVFEKVED